MKTCLFLALLIAAGLYFTGSFDRASVELSQDIGNIRVLLARIVTP